MILAQFSPENSKRCLRSVFSLPLVNNGDGLRMSNYFQGWLNRISTTRQLYVNDFIDKPTVLYVPNTNLVYVPKLQLN